MTNPDLTHLYFLLDRSGSMQSIRTDTEGGFDAFMAEQRTSAGECVVTLAQFDDHYEVVHDHLPVADVPPLQLQPRGSTALLDAIGRLVADAGAHLAALPEDLRPGTVVVGIMTDGQENASREWTHAAIKSLIEQQTREYGWQFLYLGADQDAIEVGTGMGIAADSSVTYARAHAGEAMRLTGTKVAAYRQAKSSGMAGARAAEYLSYSARERDELGSDS